jgi:hypothetical protein
MPERLYKRLKRVDASEVQGAGAFVDVRGFAWGELRSMLDGRDDVGDLDILAAKIIGWNWVDDEGEPLAVPCEHPEVMRELTQEEIVFLLKAAKGGPNADERKNS